MPPPEALRQSEMAPGILGSSPSQFGAADHRGCTTRRAHRWSLRPRLHDGGGGPPAEGGTSPFFGLTVPPRVADSWRTESSYQVVGQAESIPVLLARLTWAETMRDQHVLWFIDNNAVRQSFIKGYSPSLPSCRLLGEASIQEAVLGSFSWYARVPTASNVADPASRLRFDLAQSVLPAAAWSDPVIPKSWAEGARSRHEGGGEPHWREPGGRFRS